MARWYVFNEPDNGEPIIYSKNINNLMAFKYNYSLKGEIDECPKPAHLEFIVTKDENPIASFEFEGHAIKYNQEFLNGKGIIEPNPTE